MDVHSLSNVCRPPWPGQECCHIVELTGSEATPGEGTLPLCYCKISLSARSRESPSTSTTTVPGSAATQQHSCFGHGHGGLHTFAKHCTWNCATTLDKIRCIQKLLVKFRDWFYCVSCHYFMHITFTNLYAQHTSILM